MARKFYTPIDLTGLELQNAKIQNLASDPTPYGKGHTYFNTVHNELRVYDGTNWMPVGGAVEYGNTAGRPAAGNEGRVYADTQAQVLYIDNGTSWVQLGIGPDTTDSLSNKTFKGNTYFQSAGGAGGTNNYITVDNSTGKLSLNSGYALDIHASTDININSNGGNLILNPDGDIYRYSVDGNNRVATIGDITSAAITINGTTDQITVDQSGGTYTISLPNYIDKAGGEFHIRKTEYWYDSMSQNGIIAGLSSGTFDITAISGDLRLESNNNDVIIQAQNHTWLYGNSGVHAVNDFSVDYGSVQNSVYYAFKVDSAGAQTSVRNVLNIQTDNADNRFVINGNSGEFDLNNNAYLQFNNGYNGDAVGWLYPDGDLFLESGSGFNLDVRSAETLYLRSNNSQDIRMYPGSGTTYNSGSFITSYDLRVGNYLGSDGYFYVQDASGNISFKVDSASNQTQFVNSLKGYKTDFSTNFIDIHQEGGTEAIIEAPNGDLILLADGDSYLQNNGSAANQIATKGYVDGAVAGLTWKPAANLLWDDPNAGLTGATGTLAIDGHPALGTGQVGYRILIPYGDNAGIWVYGDDGDNWTLTRPADADTFAELKGAAIFIEEGDNYAATSWVQSNHYLTNFTGQSWVQFSGQGTYLAGDGIAINSQTISVHNDDTLKFTGGALGVNYGDGLTTDLSNKLIAHLGTGLVFSGGAITNDTANGYGVRKFAQTIGDNTNTSFDCYHNFGTLDVTVSIYDTTTKAEVFADVTHDTNKVNIQFADAPSTNQFRIVVVG